MNIHPRENKISFNEKIHKYYVEGKEIGTSVTKFIHSFFSEFNIEEIINKYYSRWKSDPSSQYYNKTKEEILEIWDYERDLGTLLHAKIEDFYNGKIDFQSEVPKDIEKEWFYFLQFVEQNIKDYLPFRSEMRVYDLDLDIAGSIDMLFKKPNGKYAIYDWKRTKNIVYKSVLCGKYPLIDIPDCNFWHYSLQLNMYKYILEKNYDIEVDEMCLVQLHPNKDSFILHPVADLQNVIIQMIRASKK